MTQCWDVGNKSSNFKYASHSRSYWEDTFINSVFEEHKRASKAAIWANMVKADKTANV